MRGFSLLAFIFICAVTGLGQDRPNVAAQRDAMKKLEFLAGRWTGPCSVTRGPGEPVKLIQTEQVQYKLDGLVMLIEGTGRTSDGKVAFQALATVAYDESSGQYRLRSHSGGRYLDTELKVLPRGFVWGFDAGPMKVINTMRLSEKGEWVETTDVSAGAAPARRTLEMTLSRTE